MIGNIMLWLGVLTALITKANMDGYYDSDEIYYEPLDEINYNDDIWM